MRDAIDNLLNNGYHDKEIMFVCLFVFISGWVIGGSDSFHPVWWDVWLTITDAGWPSARPGMRIYDKDTFCLSFLLFIVTFKTVFGEKNTVFFFYIGCASPMSLVGPGICQGVRASPSSQWPDGNCKSGYYGRPVSKHPFRWLWNGPPSCDKSFNLTLACMTL